MLMWLLNVIMEIILFGALPAGIIMAAINYVPILGPLFRTFLEIVLGIELELFSLAVFMYVLFKFKSAAKTPTGAMAQNTLAKIINIALWIILAPVKLAGKKGGRLGAFGAFLIIVALFRIFNVNVPNPILWFITLIGAAIVTVARAFLGKIGGWLARGAVNLPLWLASKIPILKLVFIPHILKFRSIWPAAPYIEIVIGILLIIWGVKRRKEGKGLGPDDKAFPVIGRVIRRAPELKKEEKKLAQLLTKIVEEDAHLDSLYDKRDEIKKILKEKKYDKPTLSRFERSLEIIEKQIEEKIAKTQPFEGETFEEIITLLGKMGHDNKEIEKIINNLKKEVYPSFKKRMIKSAKNIGNKREDESKKLRALLEKSSFKPK